MRLLFLQKYSSKSVSDGSAEKHERVLFVCFIENCNLSRMAVGQVALTDGHSLYLPAHAHPFLFSFFFSFFFLNEKQTKTKAESPCVAQAGLELSSPSPSAL